MNYFNLSVLIYTSHSICPCLRHRHKFPILDFRRSRTFVYQYKHIEEESETMSINRRMVNDEFWTFSIQYFLSSSTWIKTWCVESCGRRWTEKQERDGWPAAANCARASTERLTENDCIHCGGMGTVPRGERSPLREPRMAHSALWGRKLSLGL